MVVALLFAWLAKVTVASGVVRPAKWTELYGVVRSIAGVEFIKILRVYETDLKTGKQEPKPAGSYIEIGEDEVIASGTHIIKAERAEM